jgi:hypothetical protein
MDDVQNSASSSLPYSRDSRKQSLPHVKDSSSMRQPSRHSPVAPLAPLEYLQNQRRGSITDPSLHAAPTNHPIPNHNGFRQSESSSGTSLSAHEITHKTSSSDLRPNSPYTFGDATSQPIRKLLRSPSTDGDNNNNNRCSPSPTEDSYRSADAVSRNGPGFNASHRTEGESRSVIFYL